RRPVPRSEYQQRPGNARRGRHHDHVATAGDPAGGDRRAVRQGLAQPEYGGRTAVLEQDGGKSRHNVPRGLSARVALAYTSQRRPGKQRLPGRDSSLEGTEQPMTAGVPVTRSSRPTRSPGDAG